MHTGGEMEVVRPDTPDIGDVFACEALANSRGVGETEIEIEDLVEGVVQGEKEDIDVGIRDGVCLCVCAWRGRNGGRCRGRGGRRD
jgi:hypothetical protein